MQITSDVWIDEGDIEERFVRASGPGGQNVNKVATAVELRFAAGRSAALGPEALERLRKLAGSRMTADGVLVVDARRFRTQAQNRADARERLAALVRRALEPPKPRRKTRPSAAARQRRVQSKRRRSDVKQQRGKVVTDE